MPSTKQCHVEKCGNWVDIVSNGVAWCGICWEAYARMRVR